jgi:hypothetical protein
MTGLDRRTLLRTAAGGAAALLLDPTTGRAATPGFASAAQLHDWQEDLDGRGLRATASPAHERYVDVLADRLERAGVRDVHAERVAVRRWTARRWALELDGAPVRVASYAPYSGATPTAGVSGRLVPIAADATPAPGSLAGAIAVFDLTATVLPAAVFRSIAYRVHDPRDRLGDGATYLQWQPGRVRLVLDALAQSGAVGAVGIVDLPNDVADGGYYPYDGVFRDVPALFVGRAEGARLRAATGTTARLVLTATTTATSSRNLVGTIRGASDEVVLLNSHTDGPNGIEDNGPNAIAAMARHLARRPLRRTVVVSLTTGHFHGGIGQAAFVARHHDGLVRRAVAAVVVEHLGALHLAPGAASSRVTGGPEPVLLFAPESAALVRLAARAAARAGDGPVLVARPITTAPQAPDGRGFPAEGNSLWTHGGIPTANWIAGPVDLFSSGRSTMRAFDARLMRAQALALLRLVLDLTTTPAAALRALDLLASG